MDWARRASRPEACHLLVVWKQAAPQLERFAPPADILHAVGGLGYPTALHLLSGVLPTAHHDALTAHPILVALIPGLCAPQASVGGAARDVNQGLGSPKVTRPVPT